MLEWLINIYKGAFKFIDGRLLNKLDFKFTAPENRINFNFPSKITNLFQTIFYLCYLLDAGLLFPGHVV